MTDNPVELDQHRGMAAQKSTETRRLLQEVQADQAALRKRQEEFEAVLMAGPATSFQETAARARYVLQLYAASYDATDPRRQRLIANVLEDLARFSD
jgi:hypothetical protein